MKRDIRKAIEKIILLMKMNHSNLEMEELFLKLKKKASESKIIF